jgi:hypothetical protein
MKIVRVAESAEERIDQVESDSQAKKTVFV